MPAVEREITTLAGHLAAGTCRFLQLLAAFDAGGGWHGTGMRTCAQWLSWRCGLSPGTARDQLRVAHALTELPVVRRAFARGELSYSKVRALARVASIDTEASLVDVATGCTASQLDRLCAGLARARTNDEVLDQAARARFSAVWEEDGMLRISGRLTAEDGATLLAALAEMRQPAVTGPEDCSDRADQQHVSAETLEAPDAPDLPGDQYRDAGARAARSDAAALIELARHALTQPVGDTSSPVRLVVHATGDILTSMSADPAAATACSSPHSVSAETSAAEPSPKTQNVSWEASAADEPADSVPTAALDAGPGVALLPLGPDTFQRLACEALVESAFHPDDDRSPRAAHRFATTRQRRALLRRDGGCAFPGCPRRRHLHAHHRRPWSDGGPTTLDNLVLTCEHHHRLVHEGGWQLRPERVGNGQHGWLAIGPDGQHRRAAPATVGDVHDLSAAHDADVGPDTVSGHWHGELLDLGYAVSVLMPPDPLAP